MDTVWERFELECTDYLNGKFSSYASFEHEGGTDSKRSDIKVVKNNGVSFYIDVKHCPAQCGQFVLLPNIATQTFIYSDGNNTPLNRAAQIIMEHMNKHFEEYKEAGTTGKDICFPNDQHIFTEWIINAYKNKGVQFFITNNFTILELVDFKKHFNVEAKYRVKRSGSSDVGKARVNDIINHIKNKGYDLISHDIKGSKLFIRSDKNLHNTRFIYAGCEYMFSLRRDKYEVRKLSNTFNANVIFSITKKNAIGIEDGDFINKIKSF